MDVADGEVSPPSVRWREIPREHLTADRQAVEIRQTWPSTRYRSK